MHIFRSDFGIGYFVYLKTDPDQLAYMVTEITFSHDNKVLYTISRGIEVTTVYRIEIDNSANQNIRLGITDIKSN